MCAGCVSPNSTSSTGSAILPEPVWRVRQAAHLARVQRWTLPRRERAARGEKHPVFDFLWQYYSVRPSHLERWYPGIGVVLAGEGTREFLRTPGFVETPEGVVLEPMAFAPHRLESVRWIAALLRVCAERPPFFGCFGLHEWAMVYRAAEVRHEATPLRFSPGEIARIVEDATVRCSHFDAFRFFAAAARPINRLQPTRDMRLDLEQRGCLHVTMDLYKWCLKLAPFVASELMADCFELAVTARELDMRASPYDLRHLGFEPVKIETTEGRAEYEREQRALTARAEPLRPRVLAVCEEILGTVAGRQSST